ncbi:MAG: hypothetical protein Q4D26_10555 [Clostridia bacterium]|nr:hypothetical protein [Clostridia bacterium]
MCKKEVERTLGCCITTDTYNLAERYAVRKQMNIYEREGREEVLTRDYLIKLIAEGVKQIAFSELTFSLGKELYNKKEHLHKQGTPQPLLL